MNSILKDILIGIIIGAGKIIPGVSGSVLAITLGVYERIIYSINNIFNYKNIYYLSKIGFGIIISIVFLSKIIIYLLSNYYTYTIFVFVGLILGSIKSIATNTSFKYSYLTILSFIIIVILGLININSNNHNGIFYYLLSGFIESVSSIIPGISGTALLMLIGTYNMVIDIFSNILSINYLYQGIENYKMISIRNIGDYEKYVQEYNARQLKNKTCMELKQEMFGIMDGKAPKTR